MCVTCHDRSRCKTESRSSGDRNKHVCGWRYKGGSVGNIFASEKHVHVFVTNHPRYVSNTFIEAVMLNGAVGEKATRYVRADFNHVRHEGATCVECTDFLALV